MFMRARWRYRAMDKRQHAEQQGRRAETIAAWWLRCKGYRLLAKRVRTPHGEIDLVMRRGAMILFVEVKARPTLEAAQEALTPRGLSRLRAAGAIAIGRFDPKNRLNHRFDAVLIARARFPRHIPMVTHH
jgi:putative endonuclease